MRYHVILQASEYVWILTSLDGVRSKEECEQTIRWQRSGGFYDISYIATPILEKSGAWKIHEIHNIGHPKSNDHPRYHVGQEIRPVNNIYTKVAWQRMLERFWPEYAVRKHQCLAS